MKIHIILFLLFPTLCFGGNDPITSVTNTGATFVVTSETDDFGTNPLTHTWTKENIDDGIIGNYFSDTNWSPEPAAVGWKPKYSNTYSHTGQSVKCDFDGSNGSGVGEYDSYLVYTQSGGFDKVYITFWQRLDMGTKEYDTEDIDIYNAQWKGWRLAETGSLDNGWRSINRFNYNTDSVNNQQYGCEVDGILSQYGSRGSSYVDSANYIEGVVWNRIEIYAEQASGIGVEDGTFEVRYIRNGEIVEAFITDEVITKSATSTDWQRVLFGWFIDVQRQLTPASIYLDDMYVAHTQARIEIGNNENWGDCTYREIQVALDGSWSIGEITTGINQGLFSSGVTYYMWVIDSNGVRSDQNGITAGDQGYPVTFAVTSAGVITIDPTATVRNIDPTATVIQISN